MEDEEDGNSNEADAKDQYVGAVPASLTGFSAGRPLSIVRPADPDII